MDGMGRKGRFDRSGRVDHDKPFNIAPCALLTMMAAQVTGHRPCEFIRFLGDAHPYPNRLEPADRQLAREPYPLPRAALDPERGGLGEFRYGDIERIENQCHAAIPAAIAV